MKKLLIDCGNSRIKWGLREAGNWLALGNSVHGELDELASVWKKLPPCCAIGSNVAGKAVQDSLEALLPGTRFEWIRASASRCGVTNGYPDPVRLGSDRWAALIAAKKLLPDGGIIIAAGTALTVDILDDEGNFEGGYIMPGLATMLDSLSRTTCLEPGEGHFAFPAKNTDDAVLSGAILALSGAIEKISRLQGNPECLIFGGDAALLLPHLGARVRMTDNLVLEGLAEISEHAP